MTYDEFNAAIANELVEDSSNAEYLQILPVAIANAQARICRELDFLGAVTTDVIGPLTPNNRNLDWSNDFFAVEQANIITPAGTSNPDAGIRVPLLPVTKDVCDSLYPSVTGAGVPSMMGRVTQSTAVLAPWPNAAFYVEVTGTKRPPTLSPTNTTNFISLYLSDLLFAATMIEMAAWQLNFNGAGADNPGQAVNWKAHYDDLLKSALVEEARKKFQAEGWSSAQPSPVATPPRT